MSKLEELKPNAAVRGILPDGLANMAGLLMKELLVRGDLHRCLVVCPGSLAEQWQDELYRRFHLPFEILTNDKLEAARTGNWFLETNLVIARLDKLSDAEARLYKEVTDYVRDEFNRAEALQNDKRVGTVGFALTILQRRLASSPEAIYQSLRRRRERLEKKLRELELLQRGAEVATAIASTVPTLDEEDVEDLEEAPDNEVQAAEEEILDQSTAARTIAELNAEIGTLKRLEALALALRRSGEDRKWCELGRLLNEIFTPSGNGGRLAETPPPYRTGPIEPPTPSPRQKLVLFTEHRDTLSYLESRITTLLGRKEAVVLIHGGMGREERTKAQEAFKHDPEVQVLLATDAAGEGINLQRAHLMVNCDLPWNPNRIEQRFGRIHRIGQTEVCHLWNLVAEETRDGEEEENAGKDARAPRASTGWETFLQGLIDARWQVDGTWPMRTELGNRMRSMSSNALASSIVLVCRVRPEAASVASRREFLAAMKRELPEALRNLQKGNIAPVDLAQAAIGPGMAVFSRYAKVIESDGTAMTVHAALTEINKSLDEVLAEQEGEFDADTRWALAWFDQHGFGEGAYGPAETLCTAKNTSVAGMAEAGILAAKAGTVRILRVDELPTDWDPGTDKRLTVWEMVHHLIRVMNTGGEAAAAVLAGKLGGTADTARDLAYRLYSVCERRKRAQEALGYNALVQSWPEIMRLAREASQAKGPAAQELDL